MVWIFAVTVAIFIGGMLIVAYEAITADQK